MSLFESITNIVVGYAVAVMAQVLIFPVFGIYVSVLDNLGIAAFFTAVSLIRSYVIRRVFEGLR